MKIKKQIRVELFKRGLKQCPKCTKPKPFIVFSKSSTTNDGLHCYCKEHVKEYNDAPKNKKRILLKTKNYRDKPENKQKSHKYQKEYYEENREEKSKKNKEFYEKNKEKLLKRAKNWRDKNKEKIAKYHLEYERNKLKTDVNFRLVKNLRRRILLAVEQNCKSGKTIELLGCTSDQLRKYLQFKFTEGMSWHNYGYYGWHIDHKIPCARFDLSKKSDQLKCFNYTNLQPLWMEDNYKKGTKILENVNE